MWFSFLIEERTTHLTSANQKGLGPNPSKRCYQISRECSIEKLFAAFAQKVFNRTFARDLKTFGGLFFVTLLILIIILDSKNRCFYQVDGALYFVTTFLKMFATLIKLAFGFFLAQLKEISYTYEAQSFHIERLLSSHSSLKGSVHYNNQFHGRTAS